MSTEMKVGIKIPTEKEVKELETEPPVLSGKEHVLTIEELRKKIQPLKHKISTQLSQINAPIKLTEIIMVPDNTYGEFDYKFSNKKEAYDYKTGRRERVTALVAELGRIASRFYNLKKPEDIIRIHLPEFAMYPAKDSGPFESQEFEMLLEGITKAAQQLPQNIHLDLGTLPLGFIAASEKQYFLNVNLYVVCGNEPIINISPKMLNHYADLKYPNASFLGKLHSCDEKDNIGLAANIRAIDVKESTDTKELADAKKSTVQPLLLQTGVINCTAESKARFSVVTEICLDNDYKVGMHTLRKIISTESGDSDPQSIGTSHIIVSNTIPLNPASLISKAVVHADQLLDEAAVVSHADAKQEKLKEINTPTLFATDQLSFGGNFLYKVYEPYEISSNEEIEFIIRLRNELLMTMWPLKVYREQHPSFHNVELINNEMLRQFADHFASALSVVAKKIKSKTQCLAYRKEVIRIKSEPDQVTALLNVITKLQETAEKIRAADELGAALLFGIGEVFRRNLQTYLPRIIPEHENITNSSNLAS